MGLFLTAMVTGFLTYISTSLKNASEDNQKKAQEEKGKR